MNNYVNLRPGSAQELAISKNTGKGLSKDTGAGRDAGDPYRWDAKVVLRPLGHGSGLLGLPGDFTSPSRFVRATFFQATAPVLETGFETVLQAFHILNNFDIPVGSQYVRIGEIPEDLPSATQFTAVTDQTSLLLYYRTAWNSNIRCIDLKAIDFCTVKYQSHPLDPVKRQPVEMVVVR